MDNFTPQIWIFGDENEGKIWKKIENWWKRPQKEDKWTPKISYPFMESKSIWESTRFKELLKQCFSYFYFVFGQKTQSKTYKINRNTWPANERNNNKFEDFCESLWKSTKRDSVGPSESFLTFCDPEGYVQMQNSLIHLYGEKSLICNECLHAW